MAGGEGGAPAVRAKTETARAGGGGLPGRDRVVHGYPGAALAPGPADPYPAGQTAGPGVAHEARGPGRRGHTSRGGRAIAAARLTSRRGRPAPLRGSVWQQSLTAWSQAGIGWQRPADWAPGVLGGQHTEPLPVVRAGAPARPRAARQGLRPATARSPGPAGTPSRRSPWPRRRALVAGGLATTLLALVAGGVTAWNSRATRAAGGWPSALAAAQPEAADLTAGLTAPSAKATPALAGVVAAGESVVAFGSQPGMPTARPLFLVSGDAGRTWRVAAVGGPPAAPGAVPVLAAASHGEWLALGEDAAWVSPDGRSWTTAPGIAPLFSGDRVLALAGTGSGFLAVGENVSPAGGALERTPVLWISADGVSWRRRDAGQLHLRARGRAGALRWVSGHGRVLVIGGEVTRTAIRRHDHRRVRVTVKLAGAWRSTDSGQHWSAVTIPASHGGTRRLAGLVRAGGRFVAVRPGRSAGRKDAVVYRSVRGATWRFAGKLTARKPGLRITAVGGGEKGIAVAGAAGGHMVAFVSADGRRWHRAAGLARRPADSVTSLAVGSSGTAVLAGATPGGAPAARAAQPFLLLAGPRSKAVGQSALAGAARHAVVVRSLAAGPGMLAAAGSANGSPAIWRKPSGGRWSAVLTGPAGEAGATASVTGVVHGRAGWLAVGGPDPRPARPGSGASVGSASSVAPPLLWVSPDGRAWHQMRGVGTVFAPGTVLTQAAAGPSGYIVVGHGIRHGQPFAAMWWSATLTGWTQVGSWSGSPGQGLSAAFAVAPTAAGFAAVGALGGHPAAWLSADGHRWTRAALPLPPGASGAALRAVAARGARVVAVGTETAQAGPGGRTSVFAAVSTDDGRTWQEAPLARAGPGATVTALAAVPGGFVAAGSQWAGGRTSARHWWSPDGLHWRAVPTAGSVRGEAADAITALAGSGAVLTEAGYVDSAAGARPVLWVARRH